MVWAVVLFGMTLAQYGCACRITADSSDHPWLVRIEAKIPPQGTIAHGWLLAADKVMTSGSIKMTFSAIKLNYNLPLDPEAIALHMYNVKAACTDMRFAMDIRFHWVYEDYTQRYTHHTGEFALLSTYDKFFTGGGPTLLPLNYDGYADVVHGIIDDMMDGKAQDMTGYLFQDKDKTDSNAATEATIKFMSWKQCMQTANFKQMKNAILEPALTNYSLFCTDAFPGLKGDDKPDGFGVDWHIGTPLVIKMPEANDTQKYLAIGHYVFWTGQSGSPFVIATFTESMIDFIMGIYPVPPDNSTVPTFPTGKPTLPTQNPRIPTTGVIPTFPPVNGSRRCCCHFVALCLIASLLFISERPV